MRWSADPSFQTPTLISSTRALAKATAHPEVVAVLEEFDNRLAYRTFLVGYEIGATDFVLWAALKSESPILLAVELIGLTNPLRQPQGDRTFQRRSISSSTATGYLHRDPSHHPKCSRCSCSIKIQSEIVKQNRRFLRAWTARSEGRRGRNTVPSRTERLSSHRTHKSCDTEPVLCQDVQRKTPH